jgi:hypothetical protein
MMKEADPGVPDDNPPVPCPRKYECRLAALVDAALPFAKHDWMDAELEDDYCKLATHSGTITVGHWRALRAALAPLLATGIYRDHGHSSSAQGLAAVCASGAALAAFRGGRQAFDGDLASACGQGRGLPAPCGLQRDAAAGELLALFT